MDAAKEAINNMGDEGVEKIVSGMHARRDLSVVHTFSFLGKEGLENYRQRERTSNFEHKWSIP